jgi:hypothetical protein
MEDRGADRAVALGVMVLAAIIGTALVSLGADRGDSVSAPVVDGTPITTRVPTTSVPIASVPTTVTGATTTAPDPGSLAQTADEPVASGAMFDAGVQALWTAIVRDDPELAMRFFFPKDAYLQVKAIADPASDYEQRLIANFKQTFTHCTRSSAPTPWPRGSTGSAFPPTKPWSYSRVRNTTSCRTGASTERPCVTRSTARRPRSR